MTDPKDNKIMELIVQKLNILACIVLIQMVLIIIIAAIFTIHLTDDIKLRESLNKNFEIVETVIQEGDGR